MRIPGGVEVNGRSLAVVELLGVPDPARGQTQIPGGAQGIGKRVRPAPKCAPGCAPMRGPPRCPAHPGDLCLTPRKIRDPLWFYNSQGPTVDLYTTRDPHLT